MSQTLIQLELFAFYFLLFDLDDRSKDCRLSFEILVNVSCAAIDFELFRESGLEDSIRRTKVQSGQTERC